MCALDDDFLEALSVQSQKIEIKNEEGKRRECEVMGERKWEGMIIEGGLRL
ncbi:hypothetical protein RchiOBHm_Chr4g0441661 [Rosa chinensis]|uniref:Uncharacterized protein n=1 Tax=Rosa chinensis TaxID=74649 RepID=A0A2P6R3C7_ROSCH|nr:hypothetical protein RchiOBHm_Chr4g0441661 [Rosa chinensis]